MRWWELVDPAALARSGVVLGGALVFGVVVATVFRFVLRTWSRRSDTVLDDLLAKHGLGPIAFVVPLVSMLVAMPATALPPSLSAVVRQLLQIGAVVAGTWLGVRLLNIGEKWVLARVDLKSADNLRARSIQTRARVGRNLGVFVVVGLGAALVLTTIDAVRQVGTSLLASAGVAGIVIGFAAQRSLGTLFAGVQIALAEPIRLDDVVIVEGEWGRIEEITLTYVVVRVWDERRLVVPITWFLEKPFQNWTRNGSELLGTVSLQLDPEVPVEAVRAELDACLARHPELWDGRVKGVQVTDMTDRAVTVRVLVSAANSGNLWDLRCFLREELLAFLKREHAEAWARLRLRGERTGGEPPAAG